MWANFISHRTEPKAMRDISQFTKGIISLVNDFDSTVCKKGIFIMSESKLRNLSIDFAVKIIKLCDSIKSHYSLVNQLERSATSIGANIHEANYAHSKADFIAKLQIALKECYETEYWLELLIKTELAEQDTVNKLYNQCGTIRRILIASINTAKASYK